MQWSQFPAFETTLIASLAFLIWISYLTSVWKKLSGAELGLRAGLLAVALVCLYGIICKPQSVANQPAGKALVLTEPVSSIPDSLPVYSLFPLPNKNTEYIPDLSSLERNHPEIEQVYIAGRDVEPEEIVSLKRLKPLLLDGLPPQGFHWLTYDDMLNEGEPLLISGSYYNASADSVKIRLLTTEGPQDSVAMGAGKQTFALKGYPKTAGNFLATIQIKTASQTRSESVPFQVAPKESLRIAMLQAFPSFEANYLKDWLATQKHQVQAQAQVSKQALAAQQINIDAKDKIPTLLSTQTLAKTDLLILDEESLKRLSATQQAQVKNAVNQGLGILILPQNQWLQNPTILSQRFALRTTGVRQFVPALANTQKTATEAEKYPYAFGSDPLQISVLQSRTYESLVAFRPLGNGRVGAELATNTFTWLLNDDEATYSTFWTELIQALSRRKQQSSLHVQGLPYLWKDYAGGLQGPDSLTDAITVRYPSGQKQTIWPKIDAAQGVVYPVRPLETGWAEVFAGTDTTHKQSIYMQPNTAWKDLRQTAFWRANQQVHSSVAANTATIAVPKEIPLIWFFIPFLTSLGTLWWREKVQKA